MTVSGTKIRSRAKGVSATGPSAAYLALIRKFPLRPLRSDADYEKAASVLDVLAVRPEGSLEPGEIDYLDTLTLLVQAYDSEHHEIMARTADPLATLKYLMEQSGMRTTDLGRLLGSRGLASLILHGRRQLSKTHLRKLAEHFKVSPAVFLENS
jgi:HTH-type transcriptional regulator/antitoxin HigA